MAIWTPTNKTEKADLIKDLKRMADSIDDEKVQKETGKRLITSEEATKLAGLENYDDTKLNEKIEEQAEQIAQLEKEKNQLLKDHKPIPFEGVSNHLEDTGELPMPISINGGIEQDTREGYNKFKVNSQIYVFNNGVPSGEANSQATINSYNDNNINFTTLNAGYFGFKSEPITVKSGEILQLTGILSGSTSLRCAYIKVNENNTYTSLGTNIISSSNINLKKTFEEDMTVVIGFWTNGDTTYTVDLTNLMATTETDKEFEQYGSMPSLAFPSEVKGVSGHYDTKVENKNRFGFENLGSKTIAGITTTYEKSSAILNGTNETVGNFIGWADSKETYWSRKIGTFKKGKYVFSINTSGKIVIPSGGCGFYLRDINGLAKTYITPPTFKSDTNYSTTFELTETIDLYAHMYVNTAGWTFEDFKIDFQIEEGTVLTPYIEHQEQLLPIDIPFNMYSGKPYKENGKWYRENKYLEKTLDETISIDYWAEQGDYVLFQHNIYKVMLKAYCDKLKFQENWGTDNNVESIYIGGSTLQAIQIKILKSRLSVVSANGIKQWLGENNLKVVCEFKSPLEPIEITDTTLIEQLEALQKAHSYKEVTNINSYRATEDVAEMKLSGNALMSNDIRLSKLESAILSIGGI